MLVLSFPWGGLFLIFLRLILCFANLITRSERANWEVVSLFFTLRPLVMPSTFGLFSLKREFTWEKNTSRPLIRLTTGCLDFIIIIIILSINSCFHREREVIWSFNCFTPNPLIFFFLPPALIRHRVIISWAWFLLLTSFFVPFIFLEYTFPRGSFLHYCFLYKQYMYINMYIFPPTFFFNFFAEPVHTQTININRLHALTSRDPLRIITSDQFTPILGVNISHTSPSLYSFLA